MIVTPTRIRSRISDLGKRLRSAGKRLLAYVSVAVAHGRALMAHQGHDDRIGHTGVFEQRSRRVTKSEWKLKSIPVRLPERPIPLLR